MSATVSTKTFPLQDAAAAILPCFLDNTVDATGKKGLLFRNALSGSPASTELVLPADVKGKYITLLASGCDVQAGVVLTGDTAPTLVYNQAVTIGTGNKQAAPTYPNGIPRDVWIPPDAYSIVFMWSAATSGANFEGYVSSRKALP